MKPQQYLISIIIAGLIGFGWYQFKPALPEQVDWYQMRWNGEVVGHMRRESSVQSGHYQIRRETEVNTISQGQSFSFTETEQLLFDLKPPHSLLSAFYRYNAPLHLIETRLNRKQQSLVGSRRFNYQRQSIQLPLTDFTLADYLAIENWVKTKPLLEDTLSYLTPDLSEAEFIQRQVVVADKTDDYYSLSYQAGDGQTASRVIEINTDGEILAYRYGNIIELERLDGEGALLPTSEVDQYQSSILRLDKPLGEIDNISGLTLAFSEPELAQFFVETSRQQQSAGQLRLVSDVSVRVEVETNSTLARTSISLDTMSRLRELAAGVVQDAETDLNRLTTLRDFVSQYLVDKARVNIADVESLLDDPEGDCTEHTQLFNALAQSLGYQARPVNGLVYLGDDIQGFGGHQWSEVLVDGHWISFDASWNINRLTATHIRLNQALSEQFYQQLSKQKLGLTLIEMH